MELSKPPNICLLVESYTYKTARRSVIVNGAGPDAVVSKKGQSRASASCVYAWFRNELARASDTWSKPRALNSVLMVASVIADLPVDSESAPGRPQGPS